MKELMTVTIEDAMQDVEEWTVNKVAAWMDYVSIHIADKLDEYILDIREKFEDNYEEPDDSIQAEERYQNIKDGWRRP